jgi:hypothetical protein
MSTPDPSRTLANYLTQDRLRSYLATAHNRLPAALALYDWNSAVSAALYEDLGRVEVILRNTLDASLQAHLGRTSPLSAWYDRPGYFPGRHGQRALDDITAARRRASRGGAPAPHGSIIAELTFGFWRYLCTPTYLTSMWVPALSSAFPYHARAGSPRLVRADVEDRVQRAHFVRNRVAHHEPIHHRDLARDYESMSELLGWINHDIATWFAQNSRTRSLMMQRP